MEKEVRVIEDTLDSITEEGTLKLAVTGLDQKDLDVYLNSETNEVTIIYKDDNNRKNYKTFYLSEFYSATVEHLTFEKGILTLKVTYDIGKKLEIAVPKTLTETEK